MSPLLPDGGKAWLLINILLGLLLHPYTPRGLAVTFHIIPPLFFYVYLVTLTIPFNQHCAYGTLRTKTLYVVPPYARAHLSSHSA